MKRIAGLCVLFALAAIAGHITVLARAPGFFMTLAMRQMEERGVPVHDFVLVPAATPQNQTVVRPAPDLAYSVCRFDLTRSNILASGGVSAGYGSLSVFDGRTDNVLTLSLMSGEPGPRTVEIGLSGRRRITAPSDAMFVQLSEVKGLVLIRRLAPDADARDAAERAAAGDACKPVGDT